MYNKTEIDLSYRFSSLVLFPNGRQSELRKTELVKIQKSPNGSINICLWGSCEECLNATPLTDFDEVIATLGKSLFPIIFKVQETSMIETIRNFDDIKSRWQNCCDETRNKYDNAYIIERYINASSVNLKNEDFLIKALTRNTFVQFFFWDRIRQDAFFRVPCFPLKEEDIILYLERKEGDAENEVYCSRSIKYHKNETTLNGNAVLKVKRTETTFPESVSLAIRVEVEGEGYYTKRVNIKLIKQ